MTIQLLGTINLADNTQQLTESETKTIRINWEWPETDSDEIPTGEENYDITITVSAKQKIDNT